MNVKRGVYVALTMVLGLFLSFLAHAGIEIWYINRLLAAGRPPQASALTHNCFLPASLQIILLLVGLVGGYFLGRMWWQIIYVEHRRRK